MPRIRRGKAPEQPALPDPQGDEWGHDPDPDAEEPELPPAPPPRGGFAEKPSPPPASMIALGAPPEDAMAAAKWAHRVLMLQAYETLVDNGLSEPQRRKEIRTIMRDAAKHLTDAARYDIKMLILKQREEIEDRKRQRAAAELKKLPPPGSAKVIPIRVAVRDDVEQMKDIARRDRDG